MRIRIAALAALVALGLGACATIPTAGPVVEGDSEVVGSEPFVPFAEGPSPDDGVAAIISGFIRATAAGFASDFSVAREYLTPEARATWDPFAEIIVFDSGALTPNFDEETPRVEYAVPVAERIDSAGRMVEAEAGTQAQLEFTLEQDVQGQWRISDLADGSLIAQANFNRVFYPVSLIFSSADATTAIPELRWLPQSNVATWATRELVAGPSAWLADGVRTGFAPGASLMLDSVVVADGVARVALNAQAAATPEDRDLAQQQLQLTLTALSGVREVDVTAGGVALGTAEPSVTLVREPIPESVAAAFAGDRLGLWDGEQLRVTPDAVGRLPEGSTGLAMSYDRSRVAFLAGETRLVASTALADAGDALVPSTADLPIPEEVVATTTLLEGTRLLPPAYDRSGWLWSGERDAPQSLRVIAPDGTVAELETRWLAGRTVTSLVPSRDGARLLVVSEVGNQTVAEVVAVVRGEDGAPIGVGAPLQIGANVGPVVDAIWVDDLSVALLGAPENEDSTPLWIITVGGRTLEEAAVADAVAVAARHGDRSITLVSGDGTVRERAGTGWSGVATGVRDLAFAG